MAEPGRLSQIATKLDTAIVKIEHHREAVAAAQAALDKANTDYRAAVAEIQDLHKEQQAIMQDILSFGGTQHVAVGR